MRVVLPLCVNLILLRCRHKMMQGLRKASQRKKMSWALQEGGNGFNVQKGGKAYIYRKKLLLQK